MEDENDLYESGLEDESMDTMPAGEVDVIAESPLSIASAEPKSYRERLRERLLSSIDTSETEAKQYGATLAKIEEAKKNLLQAPDRRQYLQGLASKLTAPRTEADPRFFERRNLFTFLRDVGEYGQEQDAAEKERQAKLIQLQELQARYGLEEAQKRRSRAEQLAAQYLSREPVQAAGETARTRALREEAAIRGITVPELLELKDKKGKESEALSPSEIRSIRLEVASTLNGPKERLNLINEGLNNLRLAAQGNPQAEAQLNRSLASISGDKQLSLAEVETVVGAGSFAQRVTNAISKFFTGGAGDLTNEQKKELLETYEAYHAKRYNDSRNRLKNIYSRAGLTNLPEDMFDSPYISSAERRKKKQEEDAKAKENESTESSGSITLSGGKTVRPI